jgi:hypothetical protein
MKYSSRLLVLTICILMIASCASTPSPSEKISTTQICHQGLCEPIGKVDSSQSILSSMHELLALNTSHPAHICRADEAADDCRKKDVCYLVIGGIMPGNGCAKDFTVKQVAPLENFDQLHFVVDMPLSFIWTPVKCKQANVAVSILPENILTIDFSPYHCSWMVMGQMRADFIFHIDRIDADTGTLAGYWAHSVRGTGNGSGSGYALLKFGKNIDWKQEKFSLMHD